MTGWVRGSSSNSSQSAGSSRMKATVNQLNESVFESYPPPPAPNLEIIFFHGLYLGTSKDKDEDAHLWTWESSGDESCIWPQTWLVDEFPRAHIIFVSYQGRVGQGCHGNHDMYIVGENLACDVLQANIGQNPNCPVILVGHCFGGLVLKQLCLQVNEEKGLTRLDFEEQKLNLETFLCNIKGIFYYGTPHHGNSMIDKAANVIKDPLLTYFKTLSTQGARLNARFDKLCGVYGKWRTHSFGESLPAKTGLFKGVVAAPEASSRSGDLFNLLATDHTSICRPKSKTDRRFYALTNLVKTIQKNLEVAEPLYVHQCQGLPLYPTNLERSAQEVEDKLKDVFFLGLVGMGGIGKTTLAKQLFNNISRQFDYTCFVDNVKGMQIHELQEWLLRHFHKSGKRIDGIIDWLQLKEKKTLIVMDDVDSEEQLKLLPQSFGLGSRVIITSRDCGVLDLVKNKEFYEVDFLEKDDAEKLFCQHAGVTLESSSRGYNLKENVEAVVQICGGLPLTLEVIGSYLRGHVEDSRYWEETIDKLKKGKSIDGGRDDRVWATLRVSYEKLEQEEQEMFIEAATFFFQQPLDRALAAWNGAYGNSKTRWENLVRRSMAKEMVRPLESTARGYEFKVVWVHEQLRGLATSLTKYHDVSAELSEWSPPYNIIIVDKLNAKEVDAETKSMRVDFVQPRTSFNSWFLYVICIFASMFSGGGQNHAVQFYPRQVINLDRFRKLKYLELRAFARLFMYEVSGNNFPRELSLLIFLANPSTKCELYPINVKHLNKLSVLVLKNCNIPKTFLEGLGSLNKLRILSLADVSVINRFRVFSVKRLQSNEIRRLPESLGNLSRLERLELEELRLQALPESLGNLSALEHLSVSVHCSELPKSFVELSSLQSLKISSDSLECLPEGIGRLSSLRRLEMDVDRIHNLPTSFGLLSAMQYLRITCRCLENLSDSFGNLSSLEDLYLNSYSLQTLPESFGWLNSLQVLDIKAPRLNSLPESIGQCSSLTDLTLREMTSMRTLPTSFGELSSLRTLKITEPSNVEKLPGTFGNLSSLEELHLDCNRLETLPESIGRLNSLRKLELVADIRSLPNSFGQLCKMQELTLTCPNLETLPDCFGNLSSLKEFSITAKSLKSFPESVGQLSSLRELNFDCDGHECMPDGFEHWSFFPHELTLKGYETRILPRGLGVLSSLRDLTLQYLKELESLPEELEQLSSLQRLNVLWCPRLQSLPDSWGCISSLKNVHLSDCPNLKNIFHTWGTPSSSGELVLPQGDRRKELKRLAVGEESSRTTEAEGMRVQIERCDLLDESVMNSLGWLLESADEWSNKTYRIKLPVVEGASSRALAG